MQLYIESILALQAKSNTAKGKSAKIPLAIMTSGDTHERTLHLLESHGRQTPNPPHLKVATILCRSSPTGLNRHLLSLS